MTWSLVNHGTGSGTSSSFTYTLPSGAPAANDLDVLCVSANDSVSLPAGWSGGPSEVYAGNYGFYIFFRVASGTEGSTVTLTPASSAELALSWSRWHNAGEGDTSGQGLTSSASSTPSATTGTLSETGELSIAFAGLHNGSSDPASVSWSAGYTAIDEASYSGDTVAVLTAYNPSAGTSAESPSATWTNAFGNVALLVQTFTPAAPAGASFPWRFDVTSASYGAVGDGQVVTDGTMTASSATLTCSTSTPFSSGDVGKYVIVNGAGADSTSALVTTIESYDSGSSGATVTLNATAGTTVSGAVVMWATDDTAAIQSAINAAATYMEAHGYAQVYRPAPPAGSFWGVAGDLVTDGSANSQLVIPNPSATIPTPTLEFYAEQGPSTINMWTQTVPQHQGAIVSFGVFDDDDDAVDNYNTFGPYAVLGSTPSKVSLLSEVDSLPAFANINVVVRNWTTLIPATTHGLGYTSVNLGGCAKGMVEDSAALLTVNYSDATAPNGMPSVSSFADAETRGFILPGNGNNDQAMGRNLTATGYAFGVQCGEHAYLENPKIIGCCFAFQLSGSDGVPGEHLIKIIGASAEGCANGFWVVSGGESGVGFFIDAEIDLETLGANTLLQDNDSGSGMATLFGQIRVYGNYGSLDIFPPAYPVNVKLLAIGGNAGQAPGWVFGYGGFSTAGTGVAVQNPYWRDARVYVSGGTVTDIKAGATLGGTGGSPTTAPAMTATGLTAGAVDWPAGGWLAIDFSSAPTVNVCLPE